MSNTEVAGNSPAHVIVLFGQIASGKSTVARELVSLGATVIDCDEISREVLNEPAVAARVATAFPKCVDANGSVDRASLASIVFADSAALKRLMEIEIPAIEAALRLRIANEEGLVVVELTQPEWVPELLSSADALYVITCAKDVRRKRALARGMDAADFESRNAAQREQMATPYMQEVLDSATALENGNGAEAAEVAAAIMEGCNA